MSQPLLGVGSVANDGTGTPQRTAGQRINAQPNWDSCLNAGSLVGGATPGGSYTLNAAVVQAAITQAVAASQTAVWVPASLRPYNAAGVTFNTGVQMLTEARSLGAYAFAAYGAAGDGSTDDAAAIQGALTGAAGKARCVMESGKVYPFGTTLQYPEGTIIEAVGGTKTSHGTLKWIGAAASSGLVPASTTQSNENLQLWNVELDGNSLLNIGVDLHHVSHAVIRDCYLHHCNNGANAAGVRIYRDADAGYACYYNRITGGRIANCTIGVFCTGTGATSQNNCANSHRVEYTDFFANATSVYQERGNDFLVFGAASEDPTSIHFRAAGSGFHLIANRIENAAGTPTLPGLQLDSTSDTAMEAGNYFSTFTNDPVVDNGSSGDRVLRFSTYGSGVNGGLQGFSQTTILKILGAVYGTGDLDLNGGTVGGQGTVRVNRATGVATNGNLMQWHNGTSAIVAEIKDVGTFLSAVGVSPGSFGTIQGGALWMGSGAPSNTNGSNGDYYFRTDTPGTANQRIYAKNAGSWAGIV